MALECDPQGMIEVADIMAAVNKNETDIAGLGGGNTDLDARITQNESDILGLNSRVVAIENIDVVELDVRVGENEADISTNASGISTNASDITTVANSLVDVEARTTIVEGVASQNTTDITTNGSELATLATTVSEHETRISILEASAGLSQALLLTHEPGAGIDGGSSVADTWTPRNIETERYNTLGAVVGLSSVTIDVGTYKVEGFAVVTGSAHQSRVNVGGVYIYGTSMNSEGSSIIMGEFTIAVPTVVSLETNVSASIATSGFGLSTTFGTPNVYTSLHIIKVG